MKLAETMHMKIISSVSLYLMHCFQMWNQIELCFFSRQAPIVFILATNLLNTDFGEKVGICSNVFQRELRYRGFVSIEYLPSYTRFSTSSTTLCWIRSSMLIANIMSIESLCSFACKMGSRSRMNRWLMLPQALKYLSKLCLRQVMIESHFLFKLQIFFC